MRNRLIGLIVILMGIFLFLLMKKSADSAKEKSNNILEEFKKVDKDLKQSNDFILDSLNRAIGDSVYKK